MSRFRPDFLAITQTRTGFPSGNCTEATIASLLGVPLDFVPELWCGRMDVTTNDEAQPPERMRALLAWMQREHGVTWLEWTLRQPEPLPLPAGLYAGLDGWRLDFRRPHILAGPNPDGVSHMVVGAAGSVLWDPNPSRRGITAVTHIGALMPWSPE